MMNLWCIIRSPLIWGGDPVSTPEKYWQYLTNNELLEVNQKSENNREVYNRAGKVIWFADIPESSSKYLAIFNTADQKQTVEFWFYWERLQGTYKFYDLWEHEVTGEYSEKYEIELSGHGSVIYKISPLK
jgi:hypothetical protein